MNLKDFNLKKIIQNKRPGFYVGAAGALLALIAMFIYISMNSRSFSGWIIAGLVIGVLVFVAAALFRFRFLYVLSYASYLFAFYHFIILEVELRMDVIVDPGQGFFALDGIFFAACFFLLACIIVTIVASCMRQEKNEVAK